MVRDISAVILAGGQSSRAGFDKSVYFREPLRRLLAGVFDDVYFSLRREQADEDAYYADKKVAVDTLLQGPMSGIYWALRAAGRGIFVVACDMPRISASGISALLEERGRRAAEKTIATVFAGDEKASADFEPLFAVYELRAADEMEARLANGNGSMMKFLHAHADAVITVPRSRAEEDSFINLNTADEFEAYTQYNGIENSKGAL